jgi:essential nuclear protein 1
MPRTAKSSGKSRHDPLYVQLDNDETNARVSHPGKRKKIRRTGSDDDNNDVSVPVLVREDEEVQ